MPIATTVLLFIAALSLQGSYSWIHWNLGGSSSVRALSTATSITTTRKIEIRTLLSRMTTHDHHHHHHDEHDGVLYWTEHTAADDPIFINVVVPRLDSIRMIVFDKDGTLGDDKASLRQWTLDMSRRIRLEWEHLPSSPKRSVDIHDILQDFYQRIGWDDVAQDVIPSAPLAAGTWHDQVTTLTQLLEDYHLVVDTGAAPIECDNKNGNNHHVARPMTVTAAAKAQQWQDSQSTLHGCDPPLVHNLPELLTLLSRDCGWMIAICTSDDRSSTDAALEHWGVVDLVQYSICGDEVTESKPSAQPLHLLCRQANVSPAECLVVGDTTSDTGMATNAKAGLCFGVLTGSGTAEQLAKTGAHVILPSVANLPGLIQAADAIRRSHNQLRL